MSERSERVHAQGRSESVGSILAEARRAAGLSISRLSARTRVRESIIYGMERDDFSACGGDFYARGHLRNLATAVGLDAEEMLRRFDVQNGGVPLPVRAAAVFHAGHRIKLRERRSLNWSMALAVALVIVVVFGVVRLLGGSGDVPPSEVRPASMPGTARPDPAADRSERTGKAARESRSMIAVQVRAHKPAWVNLRDADGRKLFTGTLTAGTTSTWQARSQVRLVIGDAGAVSLRVNGKDLGTPGRDGQVFSRSFGPATPRPR
jgi:cytoskeletal protein RodZ